MARPYSVTNPLLFSLGFGYRWKSEPDLLLIYGPARFTDARGVHGKGWARAGSVRLCDADQLEAREARTFARTLLPYPRPLVSRASHMSLAAFGLERWCWCWCCWSKALVPWTGDFLSFVFSCISLLASFCFVGWRPFALSLLLLLHCSRCDVMWCYDLFFTFVFCRDLWFCFWPSSQPPQGFMVFSFGIILCDLF